MKILIAGGSGYIGTALTGLLNMQNHQIIILSRNPPKKSLLKNVEIVNWDGFSTNGWGHLAGEVDAIVNLSGENLAGGRWTKGRFQKIISSRIDSGSAIVQAVKTANHKPAVLFQASTIGYYGKLDDRVVTEDSPAGGDGLSRLVVDWETVTRPVEKLGVRWIAGRTGIVLSEKSKALKPLILQYQLFSGGPIGNGRQWWSWISLLDEIRAISFLLENENAYGAINLVAPEPVTMKDFGRVLASVLGRPYWFPVPAFLLKLIFGEMSTVLLDGQRVASEKLVNLGFNFNYPDLRSALEGIFDRPDKH